MRIAFALLSLLLLITCTSKRDIVSRLQGHWHTVGNDYYDSTLDINDSVVVFNKYTLVSYSEEFSLFDSVGRNPVLPFYCGCGSAILPVFSKFKLKEDYLTYDDEELTDCSAFSPLSFVKSDPNKCFQRHAFSGYSWRLKLDEFLPRSGNFVSYDTTIRNHQICHIGIGYPKYSEDGTKPRIQAFDVLIDKKEIPKLINEVKSFGQPVALYFIIDSSVPIDYVKSVINEFKKEKHKIQAVYQLVESNGQLGYQVMQF